MNRQSRGLSPSRSHPSDHLTLHQRNLPGRRFAKARRRTGVSSTTPTPSLLANFTIWPFRNTKNISTIIQEHLVARTPTSRWPNAIEISIARRAPARISRRCSTTMLTANLLGLPHTLLLRWRSHKRLCRSASALSPFCREIKGTSCGAFCALF